MVGPLVAIFVIAALHWPGMLQPVSFAGLDNVRTVFADPVFWDAVSNTAIQLVVAVPVMIVCAYMLGYYVAQKPPGHTVIRYLLFIPGLISTPAKAMVFYAALSPDGLVNGGLKAVGLGSLADAVARLALDRPRVPDRAGHLGRASVSPPCCSRRGSAVCRTSWARPRSSTAPGTGGPCGASTSR